MSNINSLENCYWSNNLCLSQEYQCLILSQAYSDLFVDIQYTNQHVWNEWDVFGGNHFINCEGKDTRCLFRREVMAFLSQLWTYHNFPFFSWNILAYWEHIQKKETIETGKGGYRVIVIPMSLLENPEILTLVPFGFVHLTLNENTNKHIFVYGTLSFQSHEDYCQDGCFSLHFISPPWAKIFWF